MKKDLIFSLLIVVYVACGGGDGNSDIEITKDFLSVPPNLELLADGQTTEIAISANCSWTVTKEETWLTVSPMSGTNNQRITVSASKNTTGQDRMAVLTVKGGSLPARMVTVTQKKAEDTPAVTYSLSVDKQSISYENKGGTQSFIITSNTNWTISCPDWCVLSTTSGKRNATISVSVGENTLAESRSGQILISGDGVNAVSISVSQQAGMPQSHQPGAGDNQPPS